MNKQTLFRFAHNAASAEEQKQVLLWLDESEDNRRYFFQLKNLAALGSLPETRATEQEFDSFCHTFGIQLKSSNANSKTKKSKSILSLGLAAAIAASIAILLTLAIVNHTAVSPIAQQDEGRYVEYIINRGVKGVVDLPDGSKVWLNSDSRIKFPSRFSGKYREVEFIGEGYFSVAKNPDFPMLINTKNNIQIEVRGTDFNLNCYPNDSEVRATLYSGAIIVHSDDLQTGARIATNVNLFETVSIWDSDESPKTYTASDLMINKNTDTTKCTAWKRGELIFEDTPLEEVIKKLERWHGVDFVIQESDIYKNILTARFKSESIQQILEMLRICCPIDFSIDKNVVTLTAASKL